MRSALSTSVGRRPRRRGLVLQDIGLDVIDVDGPFSQGGVEGVQRAGFLPFDEIGQPFVLHFEFPVLEPAGEQFLAFGGFLELFFAERLADLGPGLARDDEIEPVRGRFLVFAGSNLHDVPCMQGLPDGHGLSVDLAADAADAQSGMDVEREIQH